MRSKAGGSLGKTNQKFDIVSDEESKLIIPLNKVFDVDMQQHISTSALTQKEMLIQDLQIRVQNPYHI